MNKKFFLIAVACVCAGFIFTGCDKEDDNGSETGVISAIQVKAENGNDYNSKIDAVKAWMNIDEKYDSMTGKYYWDGYEVATGNYTSGGFTLDLPATLDAKYLIALSETLPDDIKISDANAKIAFIYFIVAYKSGVELGEFVYCNKNYYEDKGSEEIDATFFYSDRDVSIKGSETEEDGNETWDLSLKKGWNKIYTKRSYTENTNTYEYTSKEPSGLKWYFEEYYEEESEQSYNTSPYNLTKVAKISIGKQKIFPFLRTK